MAPQKRSATEAESLLCGVKALLLDIEGTTTPISFVQDKLFPYVKDNLESYLSKNFDNAGTQKDIAALRELAKKDKEASMEGAVEIPEGDTSKEEVVKALCENVKWQMGADRKSTELKQLQGHMWREAYESGAIKGELFDDVTPVLRQLHNSDIKLYVYSSGSVEAQRLLFKYSSDGNLLELFTDYFDTNVGGKKESSSYKKIIGAIGLNPDEILFLTDIPEEAAAAVQAGMRSTLVIRPGNADLTDEHLQNYACIEHFDELFGDDDDDIKKLATEDNGDADPDDEEDDDEVDEEDDVENEDDDENPDDV